MYEYVHIYSKDGTYKQKQDHLHLYMYKQSASASARKKTIEVILD